LSILLLRAQCPCSLLLPGASKQVLCVTHQPQVAAAGHAQYRVSKAAQDGITQSSVAALDAAGRADQAGEQFAQLLRSHPNNRPISLAFAESLIRSGGSDEGRRAQEVLRPLILAGGADIALQRSYGRASGLAGDEVRATEAHAEAAFLSGRAEDALNQLQALKERSDLDYYQRSRIDARIALWTPVVLELRQRGYRAGRVPDSQRAGQTALGLDHALR